MASPVPCGGRITRERYWQLVEDGVIGPDDRVELLDGVIVTMSPQGSPHAAAITRIARVLSAAIGPQASIRVQLPLDVSDWSVPEPDVALVEPRADDYVDAHPTTAGLVIEVASTSVVTDRITKSAIYAMAGIGEYWVVNLRDRGIEVSRSPRTESRDFAYRRIVQSGEPLTVLAFPGVTLAVDDLLPPPTAR